MSNASATDGARFQRDRMRNTGRTTRVIFSSLCLLFLQSAPVAAPVTVTHWGLKTGEWITIAAIVVGPFAAVLAQLWIQARRTKRDQRFWVYGTLMSLRATWVAAEFVRAMN